MSKKKILLYDGDYLRYTIGFASEEYVLLKDGVEIFRNQSAVECDNYCVSLGLSPDTVVRNKAAKPLAHCLASVKRTLEYTVKQTGADKIIIYLSGSKNFRTSIAKQREYKGNRKGFIKPLLYDNITEYLVTRFKAVTTNGYEADDAMSIRAMELLELGYDPIIATADKDLKQVPVKNYNLMGGELIDVGADPFGDLTLKFVGSSAQLKGYGSKFFYAQMLTGDTVDNIAGCAGIGSKRAFDLLSVCETEEECQKAVEDIYVKKYSDVPKLRLHWDGTRYWSNAYTLLLENAKLLWMLRCKPNKAGTHIFKPWWSEDKHTFDIKSLEEQAA